ncbi:Rieske 2Fe-2S domain-containing protein [Sphingopyxis sp. GW247-27LB]|uniref:aromatic ring-hydroxylating oxygenase subunit alpha n=1 Tax=Sphingopyxis sp. GW247-27LB TaxID=2012632 RepID=UPI000BA52DA5|nr:aromatic ring-hydroxylating dioxygenase subunit alpha [Sphingopyxis sp. GW247-27LB]PAL24241.1 p-cumate dioxygenase [Sphingopyxis sp. GW247-27LB]
MATSLELRSKAEQRPWIIDDRQRGIFRVARRAFVEDEILLMERDRLFSRCWLYIGHESELPKPNDFLTRNVGGRELIFNRDRKGVFQAFLNTCPHRGALVARERKGNAIAFRCFYHGWAFNNNGQFAVRDADGAYPDDFNSDGCANLPKVPKLAGYRGFYFVNFDAGAVSLEDYLADSRQILDLIADQGPDGMEIIGQEQRYSIRANWKLLLENSFDGYHAGDTHSTYFEYLSDQIEMQATLPTETRVWDLKNGHASIEGEAPWGRPVARWIPAWGAQAKTEVEAIKQELIGRLGEERAQRIAILGRNTAIFPNLVINDIMAITLRTFYPLEPDRMNVCGWALGVKGETRDMRKRRLDNFLEFLGPGGFATPDDVEALEAAQRGYGALQEAEWNDISRGMLRKGGFHATDEEQMRCFWREWARRMGADQ